MDRPLAKETKTAYLAIRKAFFPQWDRAGLWRFQIRNLPGTCQGKCDGEKSHIYIAYLYADADERDCLLIHEICHAVTNGGHGPAWLRRMHKAVFRARDLGRTRLADLLAENIGGYEGRPKTTREEVYRLLSDWTGESLDTSFPVLRKAVAAEYGLSVSEFRQGFPRARKVHEKAKREAIEYQKLRETFLQRQQTH